MSFDTPVFLYLLVLLVPMVLLFFFRNHRRKEGVDFMAASAPIREKEQLKRKFLFRIVLSDIFFIAFSLLMIIGLAGPRWGTVYKPDNRRGLDLVLAFDVSRSMNARDCPVPGRASENISRLEQALLIARELYYSLDDVRYATVAGKGRGILMVPLTWDSEAVLGFLASLDDSFITGSGTNLESLLDASVGAFRDNMNRRKGIILFSDGEALQGTLQTALDRALTAGIIISTVGLGSDSGAQIPVEKSLTAPGGFLLAPDGTTVISYRQESTLTEIARKSGGVYADGNNAGNTVSHIADFYRSLAVESAGGFRREKAERWQLFIIAGLICFGISRLLGYRRRNTAAGLLLASLLFSSCSFMEGKLLIMEGNFFNSGQRYNEAISSYLKAMDYEEAGPYAEYGLGLSYYALDENEAALEQYEAANNKIDSAKSEHQELRYRLNFNTGIIHFEQGDFKNSAESFRKALEIDSSRLDAKRNLELSLLALTRQTRSENAPSAGSGADEANRQASESMSSGSNEPEVREGVRALYDYLRSREQEQWRNEWTGESNSVWPDY